MAKDLREALRLIREGLILEAEDDKYDLPETEEEEATPVDEPATSDNTPDEPEEDTVTDQESDEEDPVEDEPETTGEDDEDEGETSEDEQDSDDKYDLEDEDSGDTDTDEETDENDNESSQQSSNNNSPKPGETIPLDTTSRKILAYKNFRKYRTLRDSVSSMVNELSETPTISDTNKQIIQLCIQKGSELLEKLDDYIVYRYQKNSYEVNYRNYMSFILEKRLIQEILDQMEQD